MNNAPAQAILRDIRDAGIDIRVDGDELVLKPAERLTPDLIERAKAHKPAILSLLRGDYWNDRGDRADFATSVEDQATGKPPYHLDAPMLAEPDSVDEAAMDLLILSYACGRRARMLEKLGTCPPDIAEQIRSNLEHARRVVGELNHPPAADSQRPEQGRLLW